MGEQMVAWREQMNGSIKQNNSELFNKKGSVLKFRGNESDFPLSEVCQPYQRPPFSQSVRPNAKLRN